MKALFRAATWIAGAALIAISATVAAAWNTETEDDALGWRAVYVGNPQANSLPLAGWTKNEHTELTHVVLKELGASCFGMTPSGNGGCGIAVVDLNAALFRPEVSAEDRVGDDPSTPLEERWVPPAAYFAGLPDYSWAVHDWINKNLLCPPLPDDAPYRSGCYLFPVWFGALNANHFGTQARHMYARYHRIALGLALRARTLREALAAGPPPDAVVYEAFVREAEIEALVFEAVGQHFLEDRWSTGHMWERWNGADFPQTSAVPFELNAFVGMASGLLHGSEGITKLPDPLGSPVIRTTLLGTRADPVRWRLPTLLPFPGVGDYRLEDMHDGFFGVNFGVGDLPIDVAEQRARMFACAKAGWSEVIRAFGERDGGGFGQHGVELAEDPFPDVLEDTRCWEPWATNAAIAAGWLEHPGVLDIDKQARTTSVVLTAIVGELRTRLTPLIDATWRIATTAAFDDPDGIGLAQGGIGPLATIDTGDAYAFDAPAQPLLPDYTEPESLDALPDRDPTDRGRDKQAVFGFFNRAHADWWCTDLESTLVSVRGSGDPTDRVVCGYLADRAYKGTGPAYRGKRRERRMAGNEDSDPICRYHGVETTSVDEDLPYFLHPGYVAAPGERTSFYDVHRSIDAWCQKVAVVHTGPCPDQEPADGDDDWDVAARVGVDGGTVSFHGRDFGAAAGEVRAGNDGGPFTVVVPIASWSDTEIRLDVPDNLLPEGDWFLQVCPLDDPGRCSVGRAILRVGGEQCLANHPLVGLWVFTDHASTPTSWSNYYFLPDGAVMSGSGAGAWFQLASWSVSGDTVTVQPCPYGDNDDNVREAPRFQGTWSAHPLTEEFGVFSCPGANQDVCPAMKGTLAHLFPGGFEIARGTADTRFVGGTRGYFPITSTTLQDFRCHGGCRQTWEFTWPHACGPIFQTCAGRRPPGVPFVCGPGVCPRDFQCGTLGTACGCLAAP